MSIAGGNIPETKNKKKQRDECLIIHYKSLRPDPNSIFTEP